MGPRHHSYPDMHWDKPTGVMFTEFQGNTNRRRSCLQNVKETLTDVAHANVARIKNRESQMCVFGTFRKIFGVSFKFHVFINGRDI